MKPLTSIRKSPLIERNASCYYLEMSWSLGISWRNSDRDSYCSEHTGNSANTCSQNFNCSFSVKIVFSSYNGGEIWNVVRVLFIFLKCSALVRACLWCKWGTFLQERRVSSSLKLLTWYSSVRVYTAAWDAAKS